MGGNVSARGYYDVGFVALVVAGPVPDSQALGAVCDGGGHVHVLEVILFVGDDDIDVVATVEAVIHYGEETVPVGWEIDAYDFGRFISDDVEKAWILVGEAVVILTPHGCGEEDVEGGHFGAPFDFEAFFKPFAMLVDH